MAFRWPWRRRQEPKAAPSAPSAPARPSGEWRWLPPMRPTFGDGPLTLRTDPPGVLHRLPVVPPEMSSGGVAGRASGLVTVSSGRLPGGVGSLPLRHPVRLGTVPGADDVVWDTGTAWPDEVSGVAEAGNAVAVEPVVHVAEVAEGVGAAREVDVVHAVEVTEPVADTAPAPVVRVADSAPAADIAPVVDVTTPISVTHPVEVTAFDSGGAPAAEVTDAKVADGFRVVDPVGGATDIGPARVVRATEIAEATGAADRVIPAGVSQAAELVVPTRIARADAADVATSVDVTGFTASTAAAMVTRTTDFPDVTRPAHVIRPAEDTSGIVAGADVVRAVDVPGVVENTEAAMVVRTGRVADVPEPVGVVADGFDVMAAEVNEGTDLPEVAPLSGSVPSVAEVTREPVAPRRVAPVREARELPAPLTVASTEWVGESQPPVSPWVPSEFLHNAYREKDRMLVDAYIEENGEAPFVPPTRPAPPPMPVDQPAPPTETPVAAPPVMAPRVRRASLAESRRRGIGITPAPDAQPTDPSEAVQTEQVPTEQAQADGGHPPAPEATQDEPPLAPQLPGTALAHQHTTVIEQAPATEFDVTVQDAPVHAADPATPTEQSPAATHTVPEQDGVAEQDPPSPARVAETHTVSDEDPPSYVHVTEPHTVIEQAPPGRVHIIEQAPPGAILVTEPHPVAEPEPSDPVQVTDQDPRGPVHITEQDPPGPVHITEQDPPGPVHITEQDPPSPVHITEQDPPSPVHITEQDPPSPVHIAEQDPPSPVHIAEQAPPGSILFTEPRPIAEQDPPNPGQVTELAPPGPVHFTDTPTVTEQEPPGPVHVTRHHSTTTQHAPVGITRVEPLPRHSLATRHIVPSTRERPATTETPPHAQTMTTSARTGTTLLHDPLTVQLAPLDATPPQAVALPLRRALGVDVSGIPIRRGETVAETARQLNARAFTSDGVVHLPDHAGALDSRDAAPLLAHELTHAVQQQRFGAALPSPGSALATRLEDDAVAIEGWVGGGAVGAPPTIVRQLALRDDDEDRLPTLDGAGLFDDFERVTGERITLDDEDFALPHVSAHGLLAAWQDIQNMADDDTDDTDDGGGGGAGTGTGAARPGKAVAGASVDQLIDLIADNPPRRWLDLDDQDNFEEIANRLYNHLLGRLRFDVIVERERSGTLMDFS